MGRILCIDYGNKRIGLAITDELKIISSPFKTIYNNKDLLNNIINIIKDFNIEKIVLGYPFSETYKDSMISVESFKSLLEKHTNIPIEFYNEENSTIYASSFLKSIGYKQKKLKTNIDRYAAQKILQDYLNSYNKTNKSV